VQEHGRKREEQERGKQTSEAARDRSERGKGRTEKGRLKGKRSYTTLTQDNWTEPSSQFWHGIFMVHLRHKHEDKELEHFEICIQSTLRYGIQSYISGSTTLHSSCSSISSKILVIV